MAEHQGIYHHKFRSANGLSTPFLPRTNPLVKDMKYKLTTPKWMRRNNVHRRCIQLLCATCIYCILLTYWESKCTCGCFYISDSKDKVCTSPLNHKFSSKCFRTNTFYKQNFMTLLSRSILPLLNNSTTSLAYLFLSCRPCSSNISNLDSSK